jgi:GNAT superfamily N-acetyltransferase
MKILDFASEHTEATRGLWMQTVGERWPMSLELFASHAPSGVVCLDEERVIGVALTSSYRAEGALTFIAVMADYRKRGWGTQLHDGALAKMRREGVRLARLGGGGTAYMWPGLPTDVESLRPFFEKRGWVFSHTAWDLAADLRGFAVPSEVLARVQPLGIEFRVGTEKDRPSVMAVVESEFPYWTKWYRQTAADRVARAYADNDPIAIQIVNYPGDGVETWEHLLGPDLGGIGCVGVTTAARNQGIGTALVGYGCELLASRGATRCSIGWTVLRSFYGRLGFSPWQAYSMTDQRVLGS